MTDGDASFSSPVLSSTVIAPCRCEESEPHALPPVEPARGARLKAYLNVLFIFTLYLASGLLFALAVTTSVPQLAMSTLLAMLLSVAVLRDLALLGEQHRPYQWVLCGAFLLALTTLCVRLYSPIDPPPAVATEVHHWGWIGDFLDMLYNALLNLIPEKATFLFEIWKCLLALFALLLIMRLKGITLRAFLLSGIIFLPTCFLLANAPLLESLQLLSGLVLFVTAFALHYQPSKGVPEMRAILGRLEPTFHEDPALACDILRVATRLHEGDPIEQAALTHLCTCPPPRVIDTMVRLGMATTYASSQSQTIALDPRVCSQLAHYNLMGFLHKILLLLLVMGWALLPYDLIPDHIYRYGCIDDLLLAFLVFRTFCVPRSPHP